MTYIPVFQISKNLGFYQGFPKISVIRNFKDQKLKILKFRDKHFVERVILHLYLSFCVVCFKTLFFANFLTLRQL